MSNTATTAECKHPAYEPLHSVLSLLSYFLKAPIVEPGAPVVNALARQRASLVNMLRACVGLHADPEIPLRQTRLATKSQ